MTEKQSTIGQSLSDSSTAADILDIEQGITARKSAETVGIPVSITEPRGKSIMAGYSGATDVPLASRALAA